VRFQVLTARNMKIYGLLRRVVWRNLPTFEMVLAASQLTLSLMMEQEVPLNRR
jgi:hypothetical protein